MNWRRAKLSTWSYNILRVYECADISSLQLIQSPPCGAAWTKYWECLAVWHAWITTCGLSRISCLTELTLKAASDLGKRRIWWAIAPRSCANRLRRAYSATLPAANTWSHLIPWTVRHGTYHLLGLCARGRCEVHQAPTWVSTGFRFIAHLDLNTGTMIGTMIGTIAFPACGTTTLCYT